MIWRLLQRRQLHDQDERLARTDRVVELMQSVGSKGSRQDRLRTSGRRGDSRLAHR